MSYNQLRHENSRFMSSREQAAKMEKEFWMTRFEEANREIAALSDDDKDSFWETIDEHYSVKDLVRGFADWKAHKSSIAGQGQKS